MLTYLGPLVLSLAAVLADQSKPPFDPRAYTHRSAACPALDRALDPPEPKSIDLKYVDINPTNATRTLLLIHGWPSLWSTWSNQIQEFQDSYHLIVPDLRGFGASGHPGDTQSSSQMEDFVSDFVCLLDAAGVDEVVCVGHDWGAEACWEAGRQRPDRFVQISGAVVPYMPSNGPFMPISVMTAYLPALTYQVYFANHTDEAAKELDTDIRRSLRSVLRSVQSPPPPAFLTSTTDFLGAYAGIDIPPIPFMTPEEEDYMVEQYGIQGFLHTLQFYTNGNRYGSWLFSHTQGNFSLPQPCLWIVPTEDPVANWLEVDGILHSDSWFTKLNVTKIAAAHWPQLEQPAQYNAALRTWLEANEVDETEASKPRVRDEL